jgi:hypothetical protein
VSKRFDDADYAEVLRQRLHRDDKGSSRSSPPTASSYDDLAMSTPLLRARRKSLVAGLWRPIVSTLACVVLLPLASVMILGGLWGEISLSEARSVMGSDVVESPAHAPALTLVVAQGRSAPDIYAGVGANAVSETATQFAEPERAVPVVETGVITPDAPPVAAPEVTLALLDAKPAAARSEPSPASEIAPTAHPETSQRLLAPADRDRLVQQGNEMLARGDVSGARLVYGRAAESGDARAAIGLGRTFDPKVLQTLRVYGIRPDPDQAAIWYARAKALEMRASQ